MIAWVELFVVIIPWRPVEAKEQVAERTVSESPVLPATSHLRNPAAAHEKKVLSYSPSDARRAVHEVIQRKLRRTRKQCHSPHHYLFQVEQNR